MRLQNWLIFFGLITAASAQAASEVPKLVTSRGNKEVEVSWLGKKSVVARHQKAGPWTLMAIMTAGKSPQAVFEDFTDRAGRMVIVGTGGVLADYGKSLEPTFAEPQMLYRGHKLAEVLNSDKDLLGEEFLASDRDPDYSAVAACFPPITSLRTHNFVGTHENRDKVGFEYGGRTPHFDGAAYAPQIRAIRQQQKVWEGLVGGWLPVLRFVYPEPDGNWWELVAFAPPRMDNANDWIQPVWYRVARVEQGELKWARYFDSYHPYPPRTESEPEPFFKDLEGTRRYWEHMTATRMRIDIPDERLGNMARLSIVRDIITRVGNEPKYGVFDKNYGGNEHDGFPDTFNADTTAMLEWGLPNLARDYIDNYFSKFVRDDGAILYRGPETGQFGRMLTVVAQYADYTGDTALLVRLRPRIDAVTKILLGMRRKARNLPPDNPAFGLLAGWSEADACLDPDPQRYMQPYFGNSTEAVRGFRDMGRAWERIGKAKPDAELEKWGQTLQKEAAALREDLQRGIERSVMRDQAPPAFPGIAGEKELFTDALKRDPLHPLFRSYRTYMEMLFSGNLTREQVEMVVNYRAAHRDTILGVPTAYGYATHEMAGFLSYGHAYGLLQHDFVQRFLLSLYSLMAHQYTRGGWVAPETREVSGERPAAPYCTPAQVVVPMLTRWMLAFEDPESETVWLAKGTPRAWLEDGKTIAATGVPTRYGRLGFKLVSSLKTDEVKGEVSLPPDFRARIKIRCRVAGGRRISSIAVNGRPWKEFDAAEETITLPSGLSGKQVFTVRYQPL